MSSGMGAPPPQPRINTTGTPRPGCIIQRRSDPPKLYKIWKCIMQLNSQNVTCDIEQILITLSTQYNEKQVFAQELELAKRDGLLKESTTGVWSIPNPSEVPQATNPEKDFYCFECHRGGEVAPCKECSRVYHPGCEQLSREKCGVCYSLESRHEPPIRGKVPNTKEVNFVSS